MEDTQVETIPSVPSSAIATEIETYKKQYDETVKTLNALDADYNQRKQTGVNLLNQLHGAIAALTMLTQPKPDALVSPPAAPVTGESKAE